MIDYLLGENKFIINNQIIELSEPIREVEVFDEVVVILYYKGGRDVKFEPLNNMIAYDIKTGEAYWNIEDLIAVDDKCQKWGYKDGLFFNMKKEKGILWAYEFNYNFWINPMLKKIIKIEAHR